MAYKVSNFFDYLSLLNSNVFYNCVKLESFTFESIKEDTIEITENITFLGENVFENCINIDDVYFEPNINYVSTNLFKNCINLKNIFFTDSLNVIRESAFENCISLTNIILPTQLQNLQANCFKNCSKLDTIKIYENVNVISMTAFQNCDLFLIQNKSIVINNNNSYVTSYFSTLFPYAKVYKSSEDILDVYIKDIANLLNIDESQAKQYIYNSIVILTDNNNIVNIDNLIDPNIDQAKIHIYRNTILKFIFDINPTNYNNFIIKSKSLSLTIPTSTDTTYIHVYNEAAKNVNVTNQYNTSIDVIGTYCLLSYNVSECVLQDYRINCYTSSNNYYISYSNNNFITSQQIISEKNQVNTLVNYTILGGQYKDLIFYKNYSLNFMNVFLESFQINITSGLSLPKLSETTNPMFADAYASLNVPLSILKNTFLYWSDSINVDDVIMDGLKFKVVNYEGWANIYLTEAIVYEGAISYYKRSSDIQKKQIKYDFIRYLALKIFKSANGADLFRNNDQVTTSLNNASNFHLRSKLNELQLLGEFDDEYSPNNISRILFRQILSNNPQRIIPNDNGDWNQMPFYVGDKIYLKLIINPDMNQNNILGNNLIPTINPRSYLVELNIVSG